MKKGMSSKKKGPSPPPDDEEKTEAAPLKLAPAKKKKSKAPSRKDDDLLEASTERGPILMKAPMSEPIRKLSNSEPVRGKSKGGLFQPGPGVVLKDLTRAKQTVQNSEAAYRSLDTENTEEQEGEETEEIQNSGRAGLLYDIKSFKKSSLKGPDAPDNDNVVKKVKKKKAADDYNFEQEEYEIPKGKPMTFDYKKLYFDHLAENAEALPIHKLKYLILQLNPRSDTALNFSGVGVLTDITFALLADLMTKESPRLKAVTSVILDGCHQITDSGIAWMGKAFPNLTLLSCVGCSLVTDSGILALCDLCPQLTSMDISGTQVTFLPKRWADGMRMTCTPLLYPKAPADAQKSSKAKEPQMKPDGKDLLSICIVHPGTVSFNLLSALKGTRQSEADSISTVGYQGNVSITPDITAFIVETEQSLAPLFISDRSVVIIPSNVNDKNKITEEATSIASLMVQIRAKHPNVPIILVGCSTNNQGVVPTAVITEQVVSIVKKLGAVLREKYPVLSLNKKEGTVENVDVARQLELSQAISLMERMEKLVVLHTEVNMDKAEDLKLLTTLIAVSAQGSPFFKNISYDKEIYDWALSFPSKCPGPLKSGVVTLNAAADVISTSSTFTERLRSFGAVHFLHYIGQLCVWDDPGQGKLVASNEWMCNVVNTLMNVTRSGKKNDGQNHVIDNATPVWLMTSLKEEMDKVKAGWSEVQHVIQSYSNVFFSNDKTLTPWTSLPLDSTMTLDHFTNFNQKSTDDSFGHLMMSFALDVNITPAILHSILAYAIKLHTPVHVWQTGVVINDGLIAIMIATTGYGKLLNLCAYMPYLKSNTTVLSTLIWSTFNRYKMAIDYVLALYGLQAETILRTSQLLVAMPDNADGIMHNHKVMDSSVGMCCQCGISIQESHLLNTFNKALHPTFCSPKSARIISGSVEGSIIKITGKGMTYLKSYLDVIGNNQCCFTLIEGAVRNLKIQLKNNSPSFNVVIDLKEKKVHYGNKSEDISKKLGEGTLQGTIIRTVIQGQDSFSLDVYMGPKLLASSKIPNGRYDISVDSSNFEGDGVVAAIDVSGISFASRPSELKVGMRLEAFDRKTPTLICVATIQEIKGDQLLIHFDGWTSHYDYWTVWDTDELHPLGYMQHMRETNGHKRRVNKSLQIPNKYNKPFTWPTYLKEIEAEPVPYDLFMEKQTQGTPPNATEEAQDFLGISYSIGGSASVTCKKQVVRTSRYRQDVRSAVKMASDRDVQKEEDYNWYTFLPNNLSVECLRYPVLKDILDIKKMNMHFLCDWQGLDFHFINHPGMSIAQTPFETTNKWPLLQLSACIALLLQKQSLPSDPSILIAGAEKLPSEKISNLELGLRRLLQLYITYGIVLEEALNDKAVDEGSLRSSFFEAAQERLKSAMDNDKKFFQNFQYTGTDGVMCQAHRMAMSPPSFLTEINIDDFNGLTSRIYHLKMNGCHLSTLQADLFTHFNNVTHLYLNKCNITELPPFSPNFVLELIDVRNNNLTSLPDDMDQLQNLKTLQISNNPLEILPSKISSLTSLVYLAADNIGRVDMNIVCNLVNLDYLGVSFNHIEELPDKLGELPLQTLCMAAIPALNQTSTFDEHAVYQYLKSFVVYNRIIEKDRKEMKEQADQAGDSNSSKVSEFNKLLRSKYPQFTKTKGFKQGQIPNVIFKLKKIQKLHLTGHVFVTVPDTIKDLTTLQNLNLSSSPLLESISAELANLPMKELNLRDCPVLKTPPKEVVRRGFMAVFGFLKRLLQGSVLCKRTKLMMVGLGGAGKTSLVRTLTNKQFRYEEEDMEESITDGIDITEWSVNTQKFQGVNDESSNEPLRFSVWDFAGQTVYYNTHQFFLSNRAVYLLLWNIRLGFEHAGLDFWLSSVTCHAPKAPIIVVGTHCDKVERGKLPTEELKRKFPKIAGFHFVSSYTGEGIDMLRLEVVKSALKQEYMGEKIPEAWLSLETGLDAVRAKKSLVTWEEIEDIANTSGIFDKVELTQSVQFLHDLGSVQFFDTPFLKSHVVIVPQWIVDVMACIVTVHDGPTKEGKLKHKDMKEVWKDYPKDLHPWLLRLTEEFDLTFPLSNEEANIVPCLLPNSEPKYEFASVNKDKREREAQMVYRFEYLPAGLFNRAQVRLHQFSDTSLMWKKGFMLKKNDHRALLLQTGNTEVEVTARGFKPENIIFLIHEVVECLVADSYAGVSYDFSLPCLDCASNFTLEPSMFHASKVKRAVEMKAPFLQCDKHFHVISIPEIRAAMPPDRNSDFDEHLGRSVRELQELEEGVAIKCLFIYSKKNVPDLAQEGKMVNPIDVLTDLRKEGFNVSYCDDPETANMESMTLAIKAAQNVIICMSDDFVESEQCKNLIIYTKQTLNKTITLLVVGPTTNWQKTDINLVLADELFVRMADLKSYPIKLKELSEAIKTKVLKKKVNYPECFISYCWVNSKSAVELGTPEKPGALGWADPRKIKDFLQEKGVNCWLDVNQMGQEGFFEDIADGLRKAKVMVACVSDEYAASKNCKMEFRFALSTLKIPTVLAVVGTGYLWERSEIGLLTVGHSNNCPKINVQYPNEGGMLDLLKAVQSFIPVENKDKNSKETNAKSQQDIAFQEVLELAQRKLLRQIMMYENGSNCEEYPRLIIIDLKSNETKRPKSSRTPRNKEKKEEQDDEPDDFLEDDKEKSETYCYRLFCEHELGWHESPETISFPAKEVAAMSEFLKSVSAYTVRLMAILKHTKSKLNVLSTPAGEQLQRKMEEWCTRSTSDFKAEYQIILNSILTEDLNKTYGGLKRCNMPNKKALWLCPTHEKYSLTQTDDKYKDKIKTDAGETQEAPPPSEVDTEDMETDDTFDESSVAGSSFQDIPQEKDPVVAKRVKSISVGQPARGPALPPSRPKVNRHTSGKKTSSQACRLM